MEPPPVTVRLGGLLLEMLTVLFVYLKLTGHLDDWSWLWVLSPVWLPTALVLGAVIAFFGGMLLIILVVEVWELLERRRWA